MRPVVSWRSFKKEAGNGKGYRKRKRRRRRRRRKRRDLTTCLVPLPPGIKRFFPKKYVVGVGKVTIICGG